jgi:hypothetical protein
MCGSKALEKVYACYLRTMSTSTLIRSLIGGAGHDAAAGALRLIRLEHH